MHSCCYRDFQEKKDIIIFQSIETELLSGITLTAALFLLGIQPN